MFGKSKSKNAMCTVCSTTSIVIGVFAVIAAVASLIGVWFAHTTPDGFVFGSTGGSLSLLALAANLMLVRKASKSCPCQCPVPSKK